MVLIPRTLHRSGLWFAIAVLALGGALVISSLRAGGEDTDAPLPVADHAEGLDSGATEAVDAAPAVASSDPSHLPTATRERTLTIARNESFYDAMLRLDVAHTDIMALVDACKPYRDLSRVRGGMEFQVAQDRADAVHRFRFDLEDDESYLVFDRDGEGAFETHMLTYPVEHRTCVVAGTVDVSLYESLQDSDAPRALASKMNDILGWDVDFRRDVRRGDTFRILYEEIHRDGRFVRTGPILALEYVNRGEVHRGFRFVDGDLQPGYYDEEGRNLEKQLMRAPLEYSRISSGFSARRLHPVLKRWKPHWGVDYAAPVGTPVRAAGAGTVRTAAYKKGNGRYIHIQHTNASYETYYLHLSRYAKGIRRGTKVRQGEIIGYVGATGWATGPHLDYRVKVDGRWRNPRTLKLPPAAPLSGDALDAFRSQVALSCYSLAAAPSECAAYRVAVDRPLAPPFQAGAPLAPHYERIASLATGAPTAP